MIRHWIEATRLRTLPVSVAGVIAGTGCAILTDSFKAAPALLCLIFAILAQIAANFGNEYYDFKNGIDRKGRVGFRRGVTEGEIAPKAMKTATLIYASHSHIAQDHILCHIMDWEISPLSFSSASCRSTDPDISKMLTTARILLSTLLTSLLPMREQLRTHSRVCSCCWEER